MILSQFLWLSSETLNAIVAAVLSSGIVGAVVLLVVRWLLQRAADRLHLEWKTELDKEIEKLSNQLAMTRQLLEAATTVSSQVYLATQDRVLKALDAMWNAVLQTGQHVAPYLFVYDLLLPHEYKKEISRMPKTNLDRFLEQGLKIRTSTERHRLFLGERLWALFAVYVAFTMNLCTKVIYGRNTGNVVSWDQDQSGGKDEYILALLKSVLEDDELKLVLEAKSGVPSMVMNSIQKKIALEAEGLLYGERIAEHNIEKGQKYAEALLKAQQLWERPFIKEKK